MVTDTKGDIPSALPSSTISSTISTTTPTTSKAPTTHTETKSTSISTVKASTVKFTTSTLDLLEIIEEEVDALEDAATTNDNAGSDELKNVKKIPTARKTNGGVIALALILAFLGCVIISLAFYKCRRNSKSDFSLS